MKNGHFPMNKVTVQVAPGWTFFTLAVFRTLGRTLAMDTHRGPHGLMLWCLPFNKLLGVQGLMLSRREDQVLRSLVTWAAARLQTCPAWVLEERRAYSPVAWF